MNRTMRYIAGVLVSFVVLVPIAANAATPEEIKAQITALFQQISALQQQLASLAPATTSTTSPASMPPVSGAVACPDISRPLFRGLRGDDVNGLQRFLVEQKILATSDATGFYGPVTEQAVKKWQESQGIVTSGDPTTTGFGVVGSKTREFIKRACGSGVSQSGQNQNTLAPSTTPLPRNVCPVRNLPQCDNGIIGSLGNDENGCSLGYVCKQYGTSTTTPPTQACPMYMPPQCSNGNLISKGVDANGCSLGYECRPVACPAVYFPKPECPAGQSAVPKFTTGGCSAGYECKVNGPETCTQPPTQCFGTGCDQKNTCIPPVPPSCPMYMPPYCPNGKLVSLGKDSNGCSAGFKCEPIALTAALNLGNDGTIRSTSKEPVISGTASINETSLRIEVALQSGDIVYDSGLFASMGKQWNKKVTRVLEPATYTITLYGPNNEQLARTLLHIIQ